MLYFPESATSLYVHVFVSFAYVIISPMLCRVYIITERYYLGVYEGVLYCTSEIDKVSGPTLGC